MAAVVENGKPGDLVARLAQAEETSDICKLGADGTQADQTSSSICSND